MLAPSPLARLRPGWSVVLVAVLLIVSGIPVLAQSTPTASPIASDTRLYVGHDARLTAEMPADWEPDRSLRADYRGRDGYLLTQSLWVQEESADSVAAQCEIVAGFSEFDHAGEIETTTWRGQEACRITVPGGDEMSAAGIVFAHPDPAPDGYNRYVFAMADAGHIDAIMESIAFDPALVTPRAYLDAALDFIETAWLWRDDLDWTQVRQDAHDAAGDVASTDDLDAARPSLEEVISTLVLAGPDRYAFYLPPQPASGVATDFAYIAPTGQPLSGGIGYVTVPDLYAPDHSSAYAGDMHAVIDAQREAASCGWILDLRGNGGGDLYAMLGGLMPLLEPGTLLGFLDAAGGSIDVELTGDGMIVYDGQPLSWLSSWFAAPDPALGAQPVAILVDSRTASAGEHITMVFRAQPDSRVFGQQTYGLTSAPWGLSLYDGAYIQFTGAWVTGPLGAIHPEGLVPDEVVRTYAGSLDLTDDDAVQAASAWLQSQLGCAGASATPAS